VAIGTDVDTWVAEIAEVQVDPVTGHVQVKRVVCAQDMGLVVNPQGATLQVEGCITMGLGYTLSEDIHFQNGMILDRNFDTYELPRFSAVPKIETVLLDCYPRRGRRCQRHLRRYRRPAAPVAHDPRAHPQGDRGNSMTAGRSVASIRESGWHHQGLWP
jgi:hypothetical protein